MNQPPDSGPLLRRLVGSLIAGEYVEVTDKPVLVFIRSLDPSSTFFYLEDVGEGITRVWHIRFWRMTENHRLRLREGIQRSVAEREAVLKHEAAISAKLSAFIPDDKRFSKMRNTLIHALKKYSPDQLDAMIQTIVSTHEPTEPSSSESQERAMGQPSVGDEGSSTLPSN